MNLVVHSIIGLGFVPGLSRQGWQTQYAYGTGAWKASAVCVLLVVTKTIIIVIQVLKYFFYFIDFLCV